MKRSPLTLELFRLALRIRRVEEKIVEIYPSDKIQSPVHLSLGQEHHATAIISALGPRDALFSSYRCHAVYLASGAPLEFFFAELFGKKGGISGGKAGSMHLSSPKHRMFGSSAIVGAIFSHAVGHAYGQKLDNDGAMTVIFAGDGATEEGTFYESLNMAKLYRTPLLFVIEDNGLSINIGKEARQGFKLNKLAESFSLPYEFLENGQDMEQAFAVTQSLKQKILKEKLPAILHVNTCRYAEHVGIGDNPAPNVAAWRKRDPLIVDKELINMFDAEIADEIHEALQFAEASPFPTASDILKDVTL